jgi:hypothetical protein
MGRGILAKLSANQAAYSSPQSRCEDIDSLLIRCQDDYLLDPKVVIARLATFSSFQSKMPPCCFLVAGQCEFVSVFSGLKLPFIYTRIWRNQAHVFCEICPNELRNKSLESDNSAEENYGSKNVYGGCDRGPSCAKATNGFRGLLSTQAHGGWSPYQAV